MIHPENLLLLRIERPLGEPLSWSVEMQVNHQTLVRATRIDPGRLRTIHLLADGVRRTLIDCGPENLATEGVVGFGLELFDLVLAAHWPAIQEKCIPVLPLHVAVVSPLPEVLNLPWEALHLPDGRTLGLDHGLGIRRLPHPDAVLRHCCTPLPPRPFRILHVLSTPIDAGEEAAIPVDTLGQALFEAVAGCGGNLLFEAATTANPTELRERIHRLQPQMVHLCGPVRIHHGEGYFGFEDDEGGLDLHSSHEMVEELFRESGVQCLLLSGFQPGPARPLAATGAICAAVAAAGIPLAVAWPDSDPAFLVPFFRNISEGLPIEVALNQARTALRAKHGDQHPPTWVLPALYGHARQGFLFNVAALSASVRPQPPAHPWAPLPGMHGGTTGSFLGRRPETTGILARLREGSAGVVHISGPRTSGKSTLATRLARALITPERPCLAMTDTPANPLTAGRLLQSAIPLLKRLGLKAEARQLKDGAISPRERLVTLVSILTRQQGLILLLDNLDPWPVPGERQGCDPDLAWFFYLFWREGPGTTRILVTGQTPLHWPGPLPDWVRSIVLPPLSLALLAGVALSERAIHARLPPTPEGWEEVRAACRGAQGNPTWMRLLLTIPVSQDAHATENPLATFFATWPAAERIQLARAALPHLPLPTEGMLETTGMKTETSLTGWREAGVLTSWQTETGETLWKVPADIGVWLVRPEQLPDAIARRAHRRIGDYLLRLFEENREGMLGLTWVDVLMEARFHWAQAGEIDTAVAVSGKVSHGLEIQGLFAELERINRQLLAWGSHPSPRFWIAQSCLGRGELEQALEWFQRARQPEQEAYRVEQAAAWQGEAEIHLAKGRLEAARESYHAAMLLLRTAGDREGEATVAAQVAAVHVRQGTLDKALAELHHALTLQEEIGDRTGAARTLARLAEVDLARGETSAAVQKLRLALGVQEELRDPIGESTSRALWGMLELQRQRPEQALPHFERAIVLYQELGHVVDLASTLPVAGHLLYTMQRFPESRQYFTMAIPLLRHLEQHAVLASVCHQMGVMDLVEELLEPARMHLGEALALRSQIGDRKGESATLYQLGQLARAWGLEEAALRLVGLSWRLDRTQPSPDQETNPQEALFREMAEALFLTPPQTETLLEQLWNDYLSDGSPTLYQAAFATKQAPPTGTG
ncbi:MAG: tetratricopeptide repeat protein [Magnetococcales bacterium]|nr:tetratricopeptide repeat protein [Magnetococcales bacterium]